MAATQNVCASIEVNSSEDNDLRVLLRRVTRGCKMKEQKLSEIMEKNLVTGVGDLRECDADMLRAMGVPVLWATLIQREVHMRIYSDYFTQLVLIKLYAVRCGDWIARATMFRFLRPLSQRWKHYIVPNRVHTSYAG